MPRKADPEKKIVDAALALAAERGWRVVTLSEIAKRAKMSLADVYQATPSKTDILAAFQQRIDFAMLETLEAPADGESVRDRLFDVMMQRFELLLPHRDALRSIFFDTLRDPGALISHHPAQVRSMNAVLEAAGLDSSGLGGHVRMRIAAVIWTSTFRVWLDDDGNDLAKTMAHLDRQLRRIEGLARSVRRSFGKESARAA